MEVLAIVQATLTDMILSRVVAAVHHDVALNMIVLPFKRPLAILVSFNAPETCCMYPKDGSAYTVCPATLRKKSQINVISPSHIVLTPDQPVPALTL